MDSPYVRRVAVSLALYGVEFESLPLSVFSGFDEFSRINPVVKALTVVLDTIVDAADGLHADPPLFRNDQSGRAPAVSVHPEALARDLHLLGVILAACEKAVQHVYEHRLRPEEKQHQPWIARVTGQLLAACREWDARLADRAAAAQPDQVLVTSTVVWSFIQLMIPAVVSAAAFPHIRALADSGGAAGASTVSAGLTAGVERAPQRGALKQERITSRQTRRRPPGLRRCRTRRRRWRGTAPGRPSLPPSPSAASASGFQTRGSGAPSPDGYSSAWRYIPD